MGWSLLEALGGGGNPNFQCPRGGPRQAVAGLIKAHIPSFPPICICITSSFAFAGWSGPTLFSWPLTTTFLKHYHQLHLHVVTQYILLRDTRAPSNGRSFHG
jgi:hypothetical protein